MSDINMKFSPKPLNTDGPETNTNQPHRKWITVEASLAFILMLVLLGLVAWGLKKAQAGPVDNGLAPDFSLTSFNGQTISLSELRGQVVIVNFWASWCPPCRAEAAYLEQTWRKYKDQGVVFIGVDYVDTEKEALAYIQGVPETYFIAKNGELREMQIGPLVSPQLENKIEALLAESYPDY